MLDGRPKRRTNQFIQKTRWGSEHSLAWCAIKAAIVTRVGIQWRWSEGQPKPHGLHFNQAQTHVCTWRAARLLQHSVKTARINDHRSCDIAECPGPVLVLPFSEETGHEGSNRVHELIPIRRPRRTTAYLPTWTSERAGSRWCASTQQQAPPHGSPPTQ